MRTRLFPITLLFAMTAIHLNAQQRGARSHLMDKSRLALYGHLRPTPAMQLLYLRYHAQPAPSRIADLFNETNANNTCHKFEDFFPTHLPHDGSVVSSTHESAKTARQIRATSHERCK